MSAAEHERVQVDVAPSDVIGGDDRADEGDTASTDGSRSFSSIREMLSSTEPSESPEMQDGTFSTGAKWHQHLELAVKKATGASGTPAWLNGIMAAFLLAGESAGLDLGDGSESSSTSSASDESSSSASPTGTVAGTHENGETSVIG
jgi:hypothetical protein